MRHSALDRRWGKTLLWLLVGLLIGGAAGAGAVYALKRGKNGIPGGPRLGKADELAMVPGDSIAFVHVRARDLWKAEDLADLRKVIEKAGPEALKVLDDGFVPAPSTLDRATVIFLPRPGAAKAPGAPAVGGANQRFGPPPSPVPGPDNPLIVGMLAFTEKFDASQVKEAYLKNAKAKNEGGKEYFVDEVKDIGVHFPNDKVIVVGMAQGVAEFLKRQKGDGKSIDGALVRSLAFASEGGKHVVGAINMQHFPVNLNDLARGVGGAPTELMEVGKDLLPVLKAEAFAFGIGVAGEDSRLDVRGYYKTDEDATAAETGIRSAAATGRKALAELKKKLDKSLAGPEGQKKPRPLEQLPPALLAYAGLGGLNTLDDLLANPPLKRDGSEVILSADRATMMNALYGGYATAFGMLFDSVGKVREAAARTSASNNLKQIGLAMHIYADSRNGSFPPQDGKFKPTDKGGLSWRVHILPYIDQQELYKQFRLDEPWDSEHNKKLIDKMPPTYVSPLATAPAGQTYYQGFVGKGAFFEPGKSIKIFDITDGTSNTIMAIEGGKAVIWTKPDDIPFDGKIDPKSLALPGKNGINILMADGSVRWMDLSRLTPQKLAAAITRSGGEAMFLDDDNGPGAAFPFPKEGGLKPVVPKAGGGPPPTGKKRD